MKLNIKGNEYDIIFENDVFLSSYKNQILDGECSSIDGTIRINKNNDDYNLDRLILHEIIHAYFYECGLPYYSNDETLVNWIAQNIQDIYSNFEKVKKEITDETKSKGNKNDNFNETSERSSG